MNRYEYDVLKMDISGGFFSGGGTVKEEELRIELNKRGQQGWELVNTVDTNMHEGRSRDLVLIFKREI